MEIKLSKKELAFLLYSNRKYKTQLGINRGSDLFFDKIIQKHIDIRRDDLGKIERNVIAKIVVVLKK